jgi:tetratricopeptide (TPR) repeat protein
MVAGGVIGLALIFVVLVLGFKDSALVQGVPALRRVAEISFTETTTVARFYNWGTAWKGVQERPLFGYGLGNYGPVFDKHYNPKMWNQEQWFDRVHNIVFDWLIAAGFVGLFAYLSVLGALVYYIWKPSSTFTTLERSVLTGLVAAYCFHNLFVFDNLVSYIYFMLLLAFVHSRSTATAAPVLPNTPVPASVAMPIAIVLIAMVFPLSAWVLNVPSYKQSALLIDALRVNPATQSADAKRLFEEALAYNTFGTTETRQQLISITDQVIRTNSIPLEDRQAFVTFAVTEMQRELETRPQDAKFLAFAGQLLLQTGNFEQSVEKFTQAVALAPNKQFLYQPLVETLFKQGKAAEGLALAERVHAIEPTNDGTWRQLVRSSLRAGNEAQYNALIEEAFATGRGDRVVGLAEQNLQSQPNNAQAYATLAVSLYRAGRAEDAIAVFTELSTVFPNAKPQTDALIQKIQKGEPIF